MQLRILLFAGIRELADADSVTIDVDDNANAADVLSAIERVLPQAAPLIHVSRLAIDGQYVAADHPVSPTADEFALIPPVSGG
ncbi:MoaD/ThiS family protein [Stieleria sp. TO1_6]|uniref:MoaD/ThiS family protein n=1 Tax=Stieleria tagensis TaxID=2956795 RepID=UPI00209AEFEF|nr:MoaD/ThiS family protein [Stieleria tagensis]MCO8124302.1 MoaD/ThiS family protein [Stieleria tagensis]